MSLLDPHPSLHPKDADIIFMPYNYLLDPNTRKALVDQVRGRSKPFSVSSSDSPSEGKDAVIRAEGFLWE